MMGRSSRKSVDAAAVSVLGSQTLFSPGRREDPEIVPSRQFNAEDDVSRTFEKIGSTRDESEESDGNLGQGLGGMFIQSSISPIHKDTLSNDALESLDVYPTRYHETRKMSRNQLNPNYRSKLGAGLSRSKRLSKDIGYELDTLEKSQQRIINKSPKRRYIKSKRSTPRQKKQKQV